MGKGGSSAAAVQPATVYSSTEADTVTPAIAKSITRDTASAQQQQVQQRQRLRGVAGTYLQGLAGPAGGKSKLGQ